MNYTPPFKWAINNEIVDATDQIVTPAWIMRVLHEHETLRAKYEALRTAAKQALNDLQLTSDEQDGRFGRTADLLKSLI